MHYIYSIEGNIGSGKSTLVKTLKNNVESIENIPIIYLPEPVSIWESIKDKKGKNMIEKYYENQERYAFSFQMLAYITRIHQLKEILKDNENAIIISERSVFTDKEIFAKMLYNDGKIEHVNYIIYCKWFYEFVKDIPLAGLIYVKTQPERCEKRVQQRNRKGEIIPFTYLQNCHNYHETWLNNEDLPVLTLDGNNNFLDELPLGWLSTIELFIKNMNNEYISN